MCECRYVAISSDSHSASGNFETNDVLPFIKGNAQPTFVSNDGMSADEMNMYLKNEDHLAPAGASVKFAGGGASQLLSKIENGDFLAQKLTSHWHQTAC